ncbi:MAG: thiolase family protein, partial [Evtepia sp.]
MRGALVAGVGMTPFKKYREVDVVQLGINASIDAIRDSGISKEEIQIIYCGHARTGSMHGRECGVGQSIAWRLGILGVPITAVGNFCSSGGSAFREAYVAVASGMYEVAMAIGVEKMSSRAAKGKPLTSDGLGTMTSMGFTPPSYYAQVFTRYMYENGAKRADFAQVAVKNRGNAVGNPYAQYRKAVTVDEVLNAPYIVEPITMLSCCPTGDGGAAAVICSPEYAKKHGIKRTVSIAGVGETSGDMGRKLDMLDFGSEKRAARIAYEMAGIGPEDVNVAEVHDAFTPGEIMHYENLCFCKRGDGIRMLLDGETRLTGRIAVNPSGGL